MPEDKTVLLQGLSFLLLMTAAILALIQNDYASWSINTVLAFMVLSAGNVS